MRLNIRGFSAVCVCLSFATGPVSGHHGDAGRYNETVTTVTGAVVEFQFINPHSLLIIAVEDDSGNTVEWQGELGPPNSLQSRWGWDKTRFQVGDVITMTGRALKNGGPYMTLSEMSRLVDADGNEIYAGN